MKVLFTGCTFSEQVLETLRQKGIFIENGDVNYSEDELAEKLHNYDCYINGGNEICTRRVIEQNKHLKLISFLGTGYRQYIDSLAAHDNGIPVSYTPNANAKSVAEFTVALILDAAKKISHYNNTTKRGGWDSREVFDLEGKTLGVIGMGAVGANVAKILCDGFGMKLIYNSRTPKKEIDDRYQTSMVSLDELFSEADIITLHATLSDENKGMINNELLEKMKPNAVLVNAARAELIEEQAFRSNVGNKGCFAVDVWYDEPIRSDDEVLKLSDDKFIITPHCAFKSDGAFANLERMIIESLSDVQSGSPIRHKVE